MDRETTVMAGRRELDLTPIMSRGDSVLLWLGAVPCEIDDHLAAAAKIEIASRRTELAQRGVTWGYLLGVERARTHSDYPVAWRLCDALNEQVASAIGLRFGAGFKFSFCKGYDGPAVREAEGVHSEGLHIDTHPDIEAETDLLRILINMDAHARRFRFGDATRAELAAAGLYVDRGSFHAAHIAPHVPIREVLLPGRRNGCVSCLVFWASIIPHAGITEEPGYFLYSFEAVKRSPLVRVGIACQHEASRGTTPRAAHRPERAWR